MISHWHFDITLRWRDCRPITSVFTAETVISNEVSIFTIYWFSIQLWGPLDIRVHRIPLRCFGMAKGRSKHQNNTLYLSPEEKDSSFNSETEKCLNTSSPSGKARYIFLCTFSILIAFVIGLIIGFFTKTESCENNEANMGQRGDHSVNLQKLLFVLDKEEIRRNFRYCISDSFFAWKKFVSYLITLQRIGIWIRFFWV